MLCCTPFHFPYTMLTLCSGLTKSPPLDTYLVALAQMPWKGLQGAKKCSSGGSCKWRISLTATSNKSNNNGHSSARAAHCHDLRPLRFNCRGHSRLVAELCSHPAAVQSKSAMRQLSWGHCIQSGSKLAVGLFRIQDGHADKVKETQTHQAPLAPCPLPRLAFVFAVVL